MGSPRASLRAWLAVSALTLGCVVAALPGDLEIPDAAIEPIVAEPVELRGSFSLQGSHIIPQIVGGLSVDLDQYTIAVITRMAEELRGQGAIVESAAEHRIEIQVVRISIHPEPLFTCVIDFNRRLGDGPALGFQSRANSWDARNP